MTGFDEAILKGWEIEAPGPILSLVKRGEGFGMSYGPALRTAPKCKFGGLVRNALQPWRGLLCLVEVR